MAELFRMTGAEVYKALRRPYLAITALVSAAAAGGVAFLLFYLRSAAYYPDQVNLPLALFSLVFAMVIGLYFVAIGADIVFSDQYKFNTLKNEVSFGLSRTNIYLSRFLASLVVLVLLLAAMVIPYVLCSAILLGMPDDVTALEQFGSSAMGALTTSLGFLGYYLLSSLPLWLGGLSVALCLSFLVNNNTFAELSYILGVIVGLPAVLENLGRYVDPIFTTLYQFTLSYPFSIMNGATPETGLDWAFTGQCWAIGLGWTLAAALIGLVLFHRKEIK